MSDISVEVLRAVNDLRDELRDHIKAEDGDLKRMRENAEDRSRIADERHREILAALAVVNIVEALPKDITGKPDVAGHRNDHEVRRDRTRWIEGIGRDGVKWAIVAVALFVADATWFHILATLAGKVAK